MVGKYGSPSITISYDDGPGGTPQAMGQHILEMGGVKITNPQELSHAFGDSWEESLPTGVAKGEDIQVSGHFDTTASTGPHVVFNVQSGDRDPQGASRTMVVVFGDGKTATFETRLLDYEVKGTVGAITRYTATVRPTGSITWS